MATPDNNTHTLEQQAMRQAGQQLGLELTEIQVSSLLAYADLLQKWNKTYNITAIKDRARMLSHHIYDSMAPQANIHQQIPESNSLKVLDVGSGGGLPGVVLAILNAQWQITCLDAVQKKSSFITLVAGNLGLKNLNSAHARIENYEVEDYDIVISRAFASLSDFAQWSGHCVKPGGYLLAMKAIYHEDEVQALEQDADWSVVKIETLQVPQLDAQRCLIWMERKN